LPGTSQNNFHNPLSYSKGGHDESFARCLAILGGWLLLEAPEALEVLAVLAVPEVRGALEVAGVPEVPEAPGVPEIEKAAAAVAHGNTQEIVGQYHYSIFDFLYSS
jgi:hypothetical protein